MFKYKSDNIVSDQSPCEAQNLLGRFRAFWNAPIQLTHEGQCNARSRIRCVIYFMFPIILLVLVCFWGMRINILAPTCSMEPTLKAPDFGIIINTGKYEYGDIIVFVSYDSRNYTKRLIGKAGDTIAVHDGVLYRNGVSLDEPYIAGPIEYEMQDYAVPEGTFFALGDNRNNSYDSHCFGAMDVSRLKGRMVFHFGVERFYESIAGALNFK